MERYLFIMLSIYVLALKATGGKVVQGLKLEQLTMDERKEMSFIEIAQSILEERKQGMPFQELTAEIGNFLELPEEELRSRMLQFYTDLNVDGSFLALGENQWGLREWYPFDQVDEEVIAPIPTKKKKKKSKAALEEEELLEVEDDEVDFDDDLDDDLAEDESLEALREEEAEFDDEDEELLDDDYELEDDDDELDLEEEEEEEE